MLDFLKYRFFELLISVPIFYLLFLYFGIGYSQGIHVYIESIWVAIWASLFFGVVSLFYVSTAFFEILSKFDDSKSQSVITIKLFALSAIFFLIVSYFVANNFGQHDIDVFWLCLVQIVASGIAVLTVQSVRHYFNR